MTLALLMGDDADPLLKDRLFRHQWNSLYVACPWATIFQSCDFVATWYQIYRELYKPLLICETRPDGSLAGLLTLAVTADSQQLVVAGVGQAEYHTWLSASEHGDTFIAAAMDLLRASFLGSTLKFQYLPPLAPRQWLADGSAWAKTSSLKPWFRPLMKLDGGEKLRKSLKKSSNKSRLNRMKRLGDVQFEQLHQPADLAAVFDDIIAYYDFRQGAVNDSIYFQTDPLRKQFYLALMGVKDLLHVTVLKIDNLVVAAHLGLSDGKECVLGMPAHSPFLAAHSPGKLQLLMLGVELAQQGFEVLDLTPGDDLYKERFATDRDRVHVLTVFLSHQPWQKQRADFQLWARITAGAAFKWLIGAVGIELATAKKFVDRLRSLRLTTMLNWSQSLSTKLRDKVEYQVYAYPATAVRAESQLCSIRKDCLDHLLLFQPVDLRQTRQDFLSLCLTRLEAGQHVYTWVEQDCLLAVFWLVKSPEQADASGLNPVDLFEPDSALIYDYFLDRSIRDRGYDRSLIQQIVNDELFLNGTKQVYMTVLTDDPFRQTIESCGFVYKQHVYQKIIIT